MRVESESPSGVQRTMSMEGEWPPSPTSLNDRDHLWPSPQDGHLPLIIPEDFHHQALEHLHSHFPLPVDPSLHGELDPILEPAFAISPARFTKNRKGNASQKRARMDLLSPNAAALFRAATATDHP